MDLDTTSSMSIYTCFSALESIKFKSTVKNTVKTSCLPNSTDRENIKLYQAPATITNQIPRHNIYRTDYGRYQHICRKWLLGRASLTMIERGTHIAPYWIPISALRQKTPPTSQNRLIWHPTACRSHRVVYHACNHLAMCPDSNKWSTLCDWLCQIVGPDRKSVV